MVMTAEAKQKTQENRLCFFCFVVGLQRALPFVADCQGRVDLDTKPNFEKGCGMGALKVIFFSFMGCTNSSVEACRHIRFIGSHVLSPYLLSPTIGFPASLQWTRIWCFLPVSRVIFRKENFADLRKTE